MGYLAPNMEKHRYLAKTYIAYDADGFSFRVMRNSSHHAWFAHANYAMSVIDERRFRGDTLAEIAAKIGMLHRTDEVKTWQDKVATINREKGAI